MKILIIAAGKINNLQPFVTAANRLNIDLDTASFSDLKFKTFPQFSLTVNDKAIEAYQVIYIRLVGKRLEDGALVIDYARSRGIQVVDNAQDSGLIQPVIPKSTETMRLVQAGIPMPKTIFAKLSWIRDNAGKDLGFPFVIKQTDSKRSMGIWSPRTHSELDQVIGKLQELEKQGRRFLAQEFIEARERRRILVIGKEAVAGIVRSMQFRKRFIKKINGEFPPRVKKALSPIPPEDARLALRAAHVLGIGIGGVDIVHEDKTGKPYVLEVNSAPRWDSVARDHPELNIEEEIVKYLASLA